MLKIGLIGCGIMGAMHAEAWGRLSDRAQLCAIADRNPARTEKFAACGVRIYADAEEMLRSEALDVVDICTPTALHAPCLITAMEYAHDVIVEKPLCLTVEEADLLLDAQRKTGARVQVGHSVRFNPEYEYLKDAVQSKRYGEIRTAHFKRLRKPPVGMIAFDDENVTGGVALDLHIHEVDFVRSLFGGDPDRLSAHGTLREGGVVEHIYAIYHYGRSRVLTEASWYHHTAEAGFTVRMEKATFVLENGILTVYPTEGEAFIPSLRKFVTEGEVTQTDKITYELSRFADAILANAPAVVALADAAGAIRLAKREIAMIKEDFQ
jgi:predicted dehydrogenase